MNVKTKGKELIVDLDKEEEAIFFRHGLQLIVDDIKGENKFKVLPYDKKLKIKKENKVDISDEDYNECIKIAIIDAIKTYVNEIERKNEKIHRKDNKNRSS